jgi:hypothetical protein
MDMIGCSLYGLFNYWYMIVDIAIDRYFLINFQCLKGSTWIFLDIESEIPSNLRPGV